MPSTPPVFYSEIPREFDLKCNQHAYCSASTLPCPWPSCSNGVKETEIIVKRMPLEEGVSHKRVKYHSIDEQERYYWSSEEHPKCFQAGNVVESEIWRLTNLYDEFPNIIYHYTTMEGFKGIVNEKSLWLTDHSYLNDSREIAYGVELTKERIEHYSKEKIFAKDLCSNFNDELASSENYRVCIACFSLEGDSLSQWRGYGQHGNGISLGFSINRTMFGYCQEVAVSQVVYDPNIQKKIIDIILNQYGQAFQKDSQYWRWGSNAIESGSSLMLGRMHRFIVSFKDNSFKDEREVRYFFIENPFFIDEGYLKQADKRFRVVNGVLVPYVTTKDLYHNHKEQNYEEYDSLSPESNFSLQEIVIGPHGQQQLVGKGVKEFLDYQNLDHVTIKNSTIPYRNVK